MQDYPQRGKGARKERVYVMALMRGYSIVDEEGRITIPPDIGKWAQLGPGCVVCMKVLRIKNTSRFPHLVIYIPGNIPYISPMEVIMKETYGKVGKQGRVILSEEILEELRLKPKYIVEFKIHGARSQHWAVVHNRGPWRMTTLQQRLGRKTRGEKKWNKVPIEY